MSGVPFSNVHIYMYVYVGVFSFPPDTLGQVPCSRLHYGLNTTTCWCVTLFNYLNTKHYFFFKFNFEFLCKWTTLSVTNIWLVMVFRISHTVYSEN
jgi:hypothetical protein